MSLSKGQRLGSCSCGWSNCIKIPLGDKMHFIHSSSICDDGDNGVSVCKDYDSSMFWSSVFKTSVECHIYSLAWKKNCDVLCTCWK